MKTVRIVYAVVVLFFFAMHGAPLCGATTEEKQPHETVTNPSLTIPEDRVPDSNSKPVLVRVRVPGRTREPIRWSLDQGFHLALEEPPGTGFFDLAVPRTRIGELTAQGWTTEILREHIVPQEPILAGIEPDVPMIPPEYHTYEELTQELDSLFQSNPEIAHMESLGVSTLDRRIMWGFKVSDNVAIDEDEPAVLYVSTHHGCEMIGMEYCLYLIHYLLGNYGSDQQATRWVDENEIWFVPLFNPDGYWAVSTDLNHEWRKNARDTNENGVYYEFTDTAWTAPHDGVDLNRNYAFNWELGGSIDPWSAWYRGDAPFSEDENRSMQMLATRERFQMGITFHSWGEVVIYPWDEYWNGEESPDIPVISSIADTVAYRLPLEGGGGSYWPYPGASTDGVIENWVYAEFGTICMTLEVNPYPLFIEPGDSIIPICERLFSGTTYLLDRVQQAGITGVVTDSSTGLPLEAEVRLLEYYRDYLAPRLTDAQGKYYRYLLPGEVYTLAFIAPGYDTVTVPDVVVGSDTLSTIDVAMTPATGIGKGGGPVDPPLPSVVRLAQNSPNPFNPSTTITFEIPGADKSTTAVHLAVYDMRGRLTRILVDEARAPGVHRVQWDGRRTDGTPVPSGLYFYTLRAGGATVTRKLSLIR